MMWINQSTGSSANWSRTRLVDLGNAEAIQNADKMRSLASENRLGLCNFSYGTLDPTNANASDGWTVWSEDDCVRLLVIDSSDEAVIVHGYISPVVVLATLITNVLVCAVLLQKHMRTPTNIFLVALAVSDALTGAVPLPVFLHFYTSGAYQSILVPPSWCHVYLLMSLHVPTMWHTASIWLTVGLAFQRYIFICYQPVAKRLCTVRYAVMAVSVVYVAAVVSQLSCCFEYRYEPISRSVPLGAADVEDSATERINVTGCYMYLVPLLEQHRAAYFSSYWYFRITFIHVIPCIFLVGLNARLFLAMRHAQAHHSRLLRDSESRRLAETNMATLMLLVVVGLFLLVEVPLAVMMMTMIVENTFDPLLLMDPAARRTATLVVNLIILFSYPVNFFIYCGMSHQFRQTFCHQFRQTFCRLFVGQAAAANSGDQSRSRQTFCRLFVGQAAAADSGDQSRPSVSHAVVDDGNLATVTGDCDRTRELLPMAQLDTTTTPI